MGQKVFCLFYGAKVPEEVDLWAEEYIPDPEGDRVIGGQKCRYGPCLIDQYQRFAGDANTPDYPFESAVELVGYIFAMPYGGDDGNIADLHDLESPLSAVESTEPFRTAMHRARRKHLKFVRWLWVEHGIRLPEPAVWLTSTEIA